MSVPSAGGSVVHTASVEAVERVGRRVLTSGGSASFTVRVTRTAKGQTRRRRRKRSRGPIETPQIASMMRRMMRSWAVRVGAGDVVDLAEMVAYRDDLEAAIQRAIDLGRAHDPEGWSWAKIAPAVGSRKSAAQEKYGPRRAGS